MEINVDELILIGKYVACSIIALILYTLSGMAKNSDKGTFDIDKLKKGLVKNAYILGGVVCMLLIGLILPEFELPIPGYDEQFTFFGAILFIGTCILTYYGGKGILNILITLGLDEYIGTLLKASNEAKEEAIEVVQEEIVNEEEGLG